MNSQSVTVVFATGKGGAGKSTLVRSLMAYWHEQGRRVAVLDADPKQRIFDRHDSTGPLGNVTVVAEADDRRIEATLNELRSNHDIVLVDTPGFDNATSTRACGCADLVVVPVQNGPDDADEAVEMFDEIAEINNTKERIQRPVDMVVVQTRLKGALLFGKRIAKDLRKLGLDVLDEVTHDRVEYPKAATRGLGVSITNPTSRGHYEIRLLARALETRGGFAR